MNFTHKHGWNEPEYFYTAKQKNWKNSNWTDFTTAIVESHTPLVKGERKANMSIFGSPGFCIIKLMLKSMNGLLKSMSNSRSAVIVIGASAMSFVCKGRRHNFYHIIRSSKLKQKYDFGQRFQTVFYSEFFNLSVWDKWIKGRQTKCDRNGSCKYS